jgi:hypothetical protein
MEKCNIQYSPFLQCGETACFSHEGKNVCIFHLYQAKKNDECCICLDSMGNPDKELVVLSCAHMIHSKCLSKMIEPRCPMCRKQMTSFEATKVFYPTVIEPLMIKVFVLPPSTIKCVLSVFKCTLYLATFGHNHVLWLWNILSMAIRRVEGRRE